MSESPLTAQLLRSLLTYNRKTGVLRWKKRPRSMFTRERLWVTWNKRWAGKPAGSPNSEGYLQIIIRPHRIRAHRAAFAIVTGEIPDEVDHENMVRDDNRWCNLRAATRGQNNVNSKIRTDNSSGFKGVSLHECGKWYAYVNHDKKRHRLGLHDTAEEAHAVVSAKRLELYKEFSR